MENGKQSVYPTIGESQHGEEVRLHGLIKREYFAAMTMQGHLANSSESEVSIKSILSALNLPEDTKYVPYEHYPKYVAQWSVRYADALLKQLEQ